MFGIFNKKAKLSTESYKGVRDFYPEAQAVQNYIFGKMRKAVESFGFVEYGASILEPAELYKDKTSQEIVNDQTYTFLDRGEREVTLRPEMTPSVARMIAGKIHELKAPIRWYSIPNLFRYEKPQRGRVREHWQLNADIFGVSNFYADAEVIALSSHIMKSFGASEDMFEIQINSRELSNEVYLALGIAEDKSKIVSRIIDKKDKLPEAVFLEALEKEIGSKAKELNILLSSPTMIFEKFGSTTSAKYLTQVIEILWKMGAKNVVYEPTLTRGFDYYTGIIFEVFDTNKENPRSLFGGGRYDGLVESFVNQHMPAVGFGMGDVTIADFINTHNLLPQLSSSTKLWICIAPEADMNKVYKLVEDMRNKGINVGVDISGKKLPDQLKALESRNVPYVCIVGPEELAKGLFKIRNVETREEKEWSLEEIIKILCEK